MSKSATCIENVTFTPLALIDVVGLGLALANGEVEGEAVTPGLDVVKGDAVAVGDVVVDGVVVISGGNVAVSVVVGEPAGPAVPAVISESMAVIAGSLVEAKSGTITITLATTGADKGVWSLLANSAESTCNPGLTFGHVYEVAATAT